MSHEIRHSAIRQLATMHGSARYFPSGRGTTMRLPTLPKPMLTGVLLSALPMDKAALTLDERRAGLQNHTMWYLLDCWSHASVAKPLPLHDTPAVTCCRAYPPGQSSTPPWPLPRRRMARTCRCRASGALRLVPWRSATQALRAGLHLLLLPGCDPVKKLAGGLHGAYLPTCTLVHLVCVRLLAVPSSCTGRLEAMHALL